VPAYLEEQDDGLPMRSAGRWAIEKLHYLDRMIDMFETSMRKKWSVRNYVDLLCGPGKNRIGDTGKVVLGSPLRALTFRHPFTGYYFVDLDQENTNALTARCSASPYSDRVTIWPGDCNILVNRVVMALLGMPSLNLAFLDPEGLELHWNTVATLATVPHIDLIINYPQSGLTRNMRKEFQAESPSSIDRFFGSNEWRQIYGAHHLRGDCHVRLVDFYRRNLQQLGYVYIRSQDDIADAPLMRNTKEAPLYRLLFASKHELGGKFWKQAVSKKPDGQTALPLEFTE